MWYESDQNSVQPSAFVKAHILYVWSFSFAFTVEATMFCFLISHMDCPAKLGLVSSLIRNILISADSTCHCAVCCLNWPTLIRCPESACEIILAKGFRSHNVAVVILSVLVTFLCCCLQQNSKKLQLMAFHERLCLNLSILHVCVYSLLAVMLGMLYYEPFLIFFWTHIFFEAPVEWWCEELKSVINERWIQAWG